MKTRTLCQNINSKLNKRIALGRLKFAAVKIGTYILAVWFLVWLFLPGLYVAFFARNSYLFSLIGLIAMFFNIRVAADKSFFMNNGFDKLNDSANEVLWDLCEDQKFRDLLKKFTSGELDHFDNKELEWRLDELGYNTSDLRNQVQTNKRHEE